MITIASLSELWRVSDGITQPCKLAGIVSDDTVETCTILTTTVNETVVPIHGRVLRNAILLGKLLRLIPLRHCYTFLSPPRNKSARIPTWLNTRR